MVQHHADAAKGAVGPAMVAVPAPPAAAPPAASLRRARRPTRDRAEQPGLKLVTACNCGGVRWRCTLAAAAAVAAAAACLYASVLWCRPTWQLQEDSKLSVAEFGELVTVALTKWKASPGQHCEDCTVRSAHFGLASVGRSGRMVISGDQ